jgi:MFS family permease
MAEERAKYTKKQVLWGLVAIFAVYGTVAYSVQTLTIARPKIAADLDGLSLYAWSVSIPALVMALVTVIFGKLSDMFGRRLILMIALSASLAGTVLSALSPTFVFLIVASAIAAVGAGAMMPLVFAVVGDLFPPTERAKWIGLLNIPLGVFTLTGPALGGFIVDTLNWRYLFWLAIPLLVLCLVTVPLGVPSMANRDKSRKIDFKGCFWMALAASSSILAFSFAGTTFPWLSTPILGLLLLSALCWVVFVRVETRAGEPILDPIVLRNRSFSTVALATFFSSFGTMGMMMYFPMFLQGVQGISTFHSGFITTPYGVLTAFMGVPAGYAIARTGRFKWMFVAGYGLLVAAMFALILFGAGTPVAWSVAVAVVAGLGYGVIPTINTVVVQNAVPMRLLGVAMGAIFFFLNIGSAISPAILGSTMNVAYARALERSLPQELSPAADARILEAVDDPQALLSGPALANLRTALEAKTGADVQLFDRTLAAVRGSLEAGLRAVFWIGAAMMLLALLIIATVPRKTTGGEA